MMSRYWKYLTVARTGFKESFAYRLNAVMAVMTSGFFLLLYYYIWKAIAASGQLASSFEQVMTYIVVGQIVSNTVFVNAEEFMGERVRKGTIVNELKRPISLRLQTYFNLLGKAVFNLFTKGVPVAILGYLFLGVQFPAGWNLAGFVTALFFAMNLVFAMSYAIAMLVFWTKVSWSLRMMRTLLQNLFSGVLFPLYLLPPGIAAIFDLLPFKYMVDGPIRIFQGTVTGTAILPVIAAQILWTILILLGGHLLWKRAKTKLTVQGG
jgi:ABC-2 type transport system permease protein